MQETSRKRDWTISSGRVKWRESSRMRLHMARFVCRTAFQFLAVIQSIHNKQTRTTFPVGIHVLHFLHASVIILYLQPSWMELRRTCACGVCRIICR